MESDFKLSIPSQITQEWHDKILTKLRKSLSDMKKSLNKSSSIQKIRIRNWLFLREAQHCVVDVVLDKGYSPETYLLDTSLSFDECAEVHSYIMNSNALDDFSSEVEVRFGSPGSEPTLQDWVDYKSSVGSMIRLETWHPIDGRTKFSMVLVDILEKPGNTAHAQEGGKTQEASQILPFERSFIVVLGEGPHRFPIPLTQVKLAFALPFHPHSASKRKPRLRPKRGKT